MISELASLDKVIGVKQSRKAIREGRAKRVFLACDADPAITDPVAEACHTAARHPGGGRIYHGSVGPCLPDHGRGVRRGYFGRMISVFSE